MMELHRITMPFTDTNLSMSANTHSRHLIAAQICENYSSKDLASREWYATEKIWKHAIFWAIVPEGLRSRMLTDSLRLKGLA